MSLKKPLCAAAALAVAATALTVPASAATAKKLLTEPRTVVGKDNARISTTYSQFLQPLPSQQPESLSFQERKSVDFSSYIKSSKRGSVLCRPPHFVQKL